LPPTSAILPRCCHRRTLQSKGEVYLGLAKRLSNLAKHGLDFADAAVVYESVNKVTLPMERGDEQRLADIAMVEDFEIVRYV
jgi:uncharacterized DUF497 family protein